MTIDEIVAAMQRADADGQDPLDVPKARFTDPVEERHAEHALPWTS